LRNLQLTLFVFIFLPNSKEGILLEIAISTVVTWEWTSGNWLSGKAVHERPDEREQVHILTLFLAVKSLPSEFTGPQTNPFTILSSSHSQER
jgi:hypothetical protein